MRFFIFIGKQKDSDSELKGQKLKGYVQSCDEGKVEGFLEFIDEEVGLIWKGRGLLC